MSDPAAVQAASDAAKTAAALARLRQDRPAWFETHVRSVTYMVQKTCDGDEQFSGPAMDALWELRSKTRATRKWGENAGLGGLTGTYFASNGCRIDWIASQVGEVDVPDQVEASPVAVAPEPSAIATARAWLAERELPGNQSDQRACNIVRGLLEHMSMCALFDRPTEVPIEGNAL